MNETSYQQIRGFGREFGVEIHRPGLHQLHFLIHSPVNLLHFCSRLREAGWYLVTLVANDERELEDGCFKLYSVFSHPVEDTFMTIEYGLQMGRETYPSICSIFPAVESFEWEIADLFGLLPDQQDLRVLSRSYLHPCYPSEIMPLRRDASQAALRRSMAFGDAAGSASITFAPELEVFRRAPDGELFCPVGPVHAGVIAPGNFILRASGEMIEGLELRLGYTHRGVERLFQQGFDLYTGWKLAERAAGDSSFAHSLAYAKAVEVLSRALVPAEADLLRGLLLEIERITNHIRDCGSLVQDLALDVPAAELAVLREEMMRLCGRLTGSRFLRGVNRPGGVALPSPLETWKIRAETREITYRFLRLAQMLVERADFRERTIGTGTLPRETALQLGITGLAARASGVPRDFRRQHPFGLYAFPEVQALLAEPPQVSLTLPGEMNGDVFSRFAQRVLEVSVSQQLVECFLDRWTGGKETEFIGRLLPDQAENFEWGLGYAEGWRGDVVYWVMKDKFERIYRCKVRDPSTLNWAGLRAAVAPGSGQTPNHQDVETTLVDFPIINSSFNLSYSGNDL